MRHPLRAFGDRLQSELGLRHEEREAIRWAMRYPFAALANRHGAKAEARRKRHVKRAAEKTQTYEEMTSRDLQGEPPQPPHRSPRRTAEPTRPRRSASLIGSHSGKLYHRREMHSLQLACVLTSWSDDSENVSTR
jgi:hypothetical protein